LLEIPLKDLGDNFAKILAKSPESGYSPGADHKNDMSKSETPGANTGNTPILDQYTIDITARAKKGELDPVEGRDSEIRQIIDILMRRRQNNPILTGDAGVGKTAIVEGFAMRVVKGYVPPALKNVSVRILDLGLLQAGAGVKGEFEQRLKNVITEVKSSPIPIILFIDEAHTLIGAGGQAGQNDAANLLKPALARGELRTIAATTWSEYKKYFEKDHALVRRFQVIKVDEPNQETAIKMLRGVSRSLEEHHQVRILDEAVVDAVKLSHRYISGRKLPDKAVSLLDTACARVAVGHSGTPAVIEDVCRRIMLLKHEVTLLSREERVGGHHEKRIQELRQESKLLEDRLQTLEKRWTDERRLISEITEISRKLEEISDPNENTKHLYQSLVEKKRELETIQGKEPMAHVNVDASIVASIVSDWTGIPVGKMMTDEIQSILGLKDQMEQRLIGQSHALEAISRRIRTSRANLDDPGKPIGVFLLVGPSGVGKTETALTLAELLYGGEGNVITVNMSEYQEAHTVSSLKGAPPGYVGFGTGGVLTEAVRRQPFSVVLLDEVEKAHPDVMELFYQVFDKGNIEDGEGVSVNFKNTIILLTSNIGTDVINKLCHDSENTPDPDILVEQIRPQLLQHFKPALLGRLVIIPYYYLGEEQIKQIVDLKLNKIRKRFQEHNNAVLDFDRNLITTVATRCTEVDSGARNIDNILTNSLLPELSEKVLVKMAAGEEFNGVHISLTEDGLFNYNFNN
ncbi:type VI secretion system ATPase TssH, partial [bacterium]|nr:type VI secretion system ATPase TssH [bacterium]